MVLVADCCSDATAALARPLLSGWGEVLEVRAGSPVRRGPLGTEVLLRRLSAGIRPSRLWLASTDADTVVPVDWLSNATWRVPRQGRWRSRAWCEVDSFVELPPGVAEQYDRIYRGPARRGAPARPRRQPRRAGRRLRAVGGWQAVVRGEEHHLWLGVRERGWPTMSPRSLHVTTSSRIVSRLRGGFADWLAELVAAATP